MDSPTDRRPQPARQKTYGSIRAVDGIDLKVERGEIFGILGPNGAGKTTTVEILEGFRNRDAGTVHVLGEDPAMAGRAWRSRVGVVLQDSRDQIDLTVHEVISQFASFYPRPRNPVELIDVVGLSAKANTRARALSGGQRRRLDVALGVVGNPELLFLDEPTTGFDPEARREFWTLIRGLRDGGTTVILTTHYLDEAAQLADRVAVVSSGKVVGLARPDELGGVDARTPRVHWIENGVEHTESTTTPTALVGEIAARLGPEIPGLQVVRPTLEEVYLDLVRSEPTDPLHSRENG